MKKRIAIVGTGYVGLITGISLALLGHKVFCIDSNKDKISKINNGQSPFFEPDIDKYLKRVLRLGSLHATENLEDAVSRSTTTIIAVGTPTINNKIDLSFIRKASKQIGQALEKVKEYHVVAVKSTVLPNVTEGVVKPILEKYSQRKLGSFGLVMNPEFLREGQALEDALHPDRIVIGQIDKKSGKEFAKIYKNIQAPIIFTNLPTAEMIKYASNSLLATLISFSNEISRITENVNQVDVVDVWKGVHLDRRLTPSNGKVQIKPGILNYIFSGCGFGGSCFPKDTKALASFADQLGLQADLIKSVININQTQPLQLLSQLKKALGKNLKGKKIAVLGLAFKPNTDDTRESPAFPIIKQLISEGVNIIIHDPMANEIDLPRANTVEEAIKKADAAIVVTAWDEYIRLSPRFFKKHMRQPVIIDGRRIYDKHLFLHAGITYRGIGL